VVKVTAKKPGYATKTKKSKKIQIRGR